MPQSLLTTRGKEQVEVTLIFGSAVTKTWLNKILKKGFAHVRVVIHRRDYSILIDPRVSYTDVECYAGNVKITPDEGETVVRLRRKIDVYKTRRLFGPLNCVETVKAFIGDRSFWCFTPYQLYKKYGKRG